MDNTSRQVAWAMGGFCAGFVLCFLLYAPSPATSKRNVPIGPVYTFTQSQTQPVHVPLPPAEPAAKSRRLDAGPRDSVVDPLRPPERSLDLIDNR